MVLKHNVKTTACLSLVFRGSVYGLLYIHVTENHYFTEFEKNALTLFANQAAIVLQNLKISGGLYKNEYGDFLFRMCCNPLLKLCTPAKYSLLDAITAVLKNNEERLPTSYKDEAVECIQEIVTDIVKSAGLPIYISNTYKGFIKQEDFLYLSPTYRDHFFHPFHTFLLGFSIFKKTIDSEVVAFDINNGFICQWITAALWHDTSYASAKGPDWLRDFIKKHTGVLIETSQDWTPLMQKTEILTAIEHLCDTFTINCNNKAKRIPFTGWLNKQLLDYNDHGVFSAILLLMEYAKIAEHHDANITDYIHQSALAIALHNYHKAYAGDRQLKKRIDLKDPDSKFTTPALEVGQLAVKDYPLAFLLAFCDTAQEWGRPNSKGYSDKGKYEFQDVIINPNLAHKKGPMRKPDVKIDLKVLMVESLDSKNIMVDLLDKNGQLSDAWKFDHCSFYINHEPLTVDAES